MSSENLCVRGSGDLEAVLYDSKLHNTGALRIKKYDIMLRSREQKGLAGN